MARTETQDFRRWLRKRLFEILDGLKSDVETNAQWPDFNSEHILSDIEIARSTLGETLEEWDNVLAGVVEKITEAADQIEQTRSHPVCLLAPAAANLDGVLELLGEGENE